MRLPLALYPLQTSFFHLSSANAVNRMEYTYSMVFSKWCGKFMQWFCYVRVVLLQRMPFNVHAKIYMNSEKTRAAKKKNKQIRNLWMKTHKNAAAFFLLFRRLLFACSKMERWNESGFFSPNFLLVVFMLSLCVCVYVVHCYCGTHNENYGRIGLDESFYFFFLHHAVPLSSGISCVCHQARVSANPACLAMICYELWNVPEQDFGVST